MRIDTLRAYFFIICLLASPSLISAVVERLIPESVTKLPHQRPAYTQGLAIEGEQLYESTGLYGQSSLRLLDIPTGNITRKKDLSSTFFAEGIAVFPKTIIQITWKEQRAFLYDRQTFDLLKEFLYSGEGWGLCRDGETVWMSNGTHQLIQRDSETFEIINTLNVHQGTRLIESLNDLECTGPHLFANIFGTNVIVRIDKATGELTGVIDASRLLTPQEKRSLTSDEVLNGIAYRPQTDTFFLTGKNWPWLVEVRLHPAK